jgi:glucose dehydrogenase
VWHYQTGPGETWYHTATQHIMLAELEIGGKARKVLMQAPKNGFFYVLDRETGELISANNYTVVNWASGIDRETGRPLETPQARNFSERRPTLSTAGMLVFQGDMYGNFAAYDAESGVRLWAKPAPTGVMAPPITYSIDGEQ